MKRNMLLILSCVWLLSALSIPVCAAGTNTYTLPELNMSVALPSSFIVFTRDIKKGDPNLSAYGLTKDNISSLMASNNIYLNAWDKKANFEIVITMVECTLENLNQFSDSALLESADASKSGYKSKGYTYIKSEIYCHPQTKFIKFYFSQPDGDDTVYGLQYYTVYGGKAINIILWSYTGRLASSQEATLQSIAGSAVFKAEPQTAQTAPGAAGAFTYTDPKTSVSFTVPANWSEDVSLTDMEQETGDTKFVSNATGMFILYNSIDVWDRMTDSQRMGFKRSDINSSYYSMEEIAKPLGLSASQLSTVTYGGVQYYQAETTEAIEVSGIDLNVTITHVLMLDNGYLYLFQTNTTPDDKNYGDFESLLDSVHYPTLSLASAAGNSISRTDGTAAGNPTAAQIAAALILTVIIYSLPILLYRYAVKKVPVEKRKAWEITTAYGFLAFIVMSALLRAFTGSWVPGGGIVFWSYVNYRILTSGSKRCDGTQAADASDGAGNMPHGVDTALSGRTEEGPGPVGGGAGADDAGSAQAKDPETASGTDGEAEIRFCRICGNKLRPGSVYCDKCGTAVHPEGI